MKTGLLIGHGDHKAEGQWFCSVKVILISGSGMIRRGVIVYS